jgi:hypothetical protein
MILVRQQPANKIVRRLTYSRTRTLSRPSNIEDADIVFRDPLADERRFRCPAQFHEQTRFATLDRQTSRQLGAAQHAVPKQD